MTSVEDTECFLRFKPKPFYERSSYELGFVLSGKKRTILLLIKTGIRVLGTQTVDRTKRLHIPKRVLFMSTDGQFGATFILLCAGAPSSAQ